MNWKLEIGSLNLNLTYIFGIGSRNWKSGIGNRELAVGIGCACYWKGLEIESLVRNWNWKLKMETEIGNQN